MPHHKIILDDVCEPQTRLETDFRLAVLRFVSGFVILLKTFTVQSNNQAITFTSSAGMKMNIC